MTRLRRWLGRPRVRRFVIQVALLPLLFGLSLVGSGVVQLVTLIVLLAAWPIAVAMALLLIWLSRLDPTIESLADAADNALSVALGASALAAVSVIVLARQFGLLTEPIGQVLLVGLSWALIVFVVPALSWAATLRKVWLPMLTDRLGRER